MKGIVVVLFLVFALFLLDKRLRKSNRVYVVPSLPFGLRGAFIPPFGTLIAAIHDTSTVRNHEQCHYEQYSRLGIGVFAVRYLWQYVTKGYNNMPMESECRTEESAFCQSNYSQCYPKSII